MERDFRASQIDIGSALFFPAYFLENIKSLDERQDQEGNF